VGDLRGGCGFPAWMVVDVGSPAVIEYTILSFSPPAGRSREVLSLALERGDVPGQQPNLNYPIVNVVNYIRLLHRIFTFAFSV